MHEDIFCLCLPCNRSINLALVVEEMLAYGNRLRSTYSSEFHYLDYAGFVYVKIVSYLILKRLVLLKIQGY